MQYKCLRSLSPVELGLVRSVQLPARAALKAAAAAAAIYSVLLPKHACVARPFLPLAYGKASIRRRVRNARSNIDTIHYIDDPLLLCVGVRSDKPSDAPLVEVQVFTRRAQWQSNTMLKRSTVKMSSTTRVPHYHSTLLRYLYFTFRALRARRAIEGERGAVRSALGKVQQLAHARRII